VAWEAIVPRLSDHFTCFVPSLRGRGLSEDSEDHSPPRLEEDVTAFVSSIGEPVFLVGWSAGVPWALAAAAHSGAVTAVVAYEPTIVPLIRGGDAASRDAMYGQFGEAVAEGRLADAARAFHVFVCTESEMASFDADYFHRCAASMPALLQAGKHGASYEGSVSTDPDVLAMVAAPVLLLRGEQTRLRTFYADTEHYVAEHVADPQIREPLPGLGHLGPLLAPDPIATELIAFFGSFQRSA
jgi:hypothetical protein